MKTIYTLLKNDLKAVKAWFSTQTFSKIFVFFGFVLVFIGTFLFLYYISTIFFSSLFSYNKFGNLTADYIIRAAIACIFLLGIGSSIASTLNIFYSPDKNLSLLLSLPVKTIDIIIWLFLKTITINFIFLFIFIFPLCLSFSVYSGSLSFLFLLRTIFVLLSITILTGSIGGIIALLFSKILSKRTHFITLLGVFFFFSLMSGLLRLIFPPNFMHLYDASSEQFLTVFNQLPLNNTLLPVNWLSSLITGSSAVNFLLSLTMVLIFSVSFVLLQKIRFIRLLQELSVISSAPEEVKKISSRTKLNIPFEKMSTGLSLVVKDVISITRMSSEVGYGLFLLIMMGTFFLFYSRIKIMQTVEIKWIIILTIYSYLWLIFFANAFYLRLVFPLFAKEAQSSWYLFTLPINKKTILYSKIFSALLAGLPLVIFSIAVWFLLSFAKENKIILSLSSLWAVLILPVVHVLLGAVYPNFQEGSNPEKVSTSSMGILTLIISSVIAIVFALSLYQFITNSLSILMVLVIHLSVGILTLTAVYTVSKSFLKKYEF